MPGRGGKVGCGPGLMGNLMFEQRIKRNERRSQAGIWRRQFQAEEPAGAKAPR